MGEEISKCPKCGSRDSVWRGYRYNKSGKKRLRKCKKCGVNFTPDDGFLRRRFQKEHIVEAVSLYQSGLSLSKVKDHMWQHHGVKISRWMILLWCRDYSNLIDKFTQTLKPEIKGNVHADEVIVKTKGKKNWYWGAKDKKTKFKIAGKLTKKRTLSGAKYIFDKIRNGCKGIPAKIITDKLGHYRRAYNIFFYRVRGKCKLIHGVPIACKKHGLEHNNNCAERDNERIKQRYKTTRGFKNSDSAEDILRLMDNCYNFVHPHMGLRGKTPAEEADINLKLERNKLMNLIKLFHFDDHRYVRVWNAENLPLTHIYLYN